MRGGGGRGGQVGQNEIVCLLGSGLASGGACGEVRDCVGGVRGVREEEM